MTFFYYRVGLASMTQGRTASTITSSDSSWSLPRMDSMVWVRNGTEDGSSMRASVYLRSFSECGLGIKGGTPLTPLDYLL